MIRDPQIFFRSMHVSTRLQHDDYQQAVLQAYYLLPGFVSGRKLGVRWCVLANNTVWWRLVQTKVYGRKIEVTGESYSVSAKVKQANKGTRSFQSPFKLQLTMSFLISKYYYSTLCSVSFTSWKYCLFGCMPSVSK